jgi:endonuclease/exonuclease/phosphatase family metal-dependent hydrolase
MKIVTWNIDYDERTLDARKTLILGELKRLCADIICLQEVSPNIYPYLNIGLENYNSFGFQQNKIFSNVIWYSKNLEETPILETIVLPSNMYRYSILTKLSNVYIYSTHLESCKENKHIRVQQINHIIDNIPPNIPCIICGDLNFIDSDEMIDIPYVDVSPENPSYDSYINSNSCHGYISFLDRVFSRYIKKENISTKLIGTQSKDGMFPSDHFGILITLNFKCDILRGENKTQSHLKKIIY